MKQLIVETFKVKGLAIWQNSTKAVINVVVRSCQIRGFFVVLTGSYQACNLNYISVEKKHFALQFLHPTMTRIYMNYQVIS